MTRHVFTYGTLQCGHHNHGLVRPMVRAASRATVRGQLYMGPGYPYLRLDAEAGLVHGDLLRFDKRDMGTVLKRLDELEGYNPNNPMSLYVRRRVRVRTATHCVRAWIYEVGPWFEGKDIKPLPSASWQQEFAGWI